MAKLNNTGNKARKQLAFHRRGAKLKSFKRPFFLRFDRENIIAVMNSWIDWNRDTESDKRVKGLDSQRKNYISEYKQALEFAPETPEKGVGLDSDQGWRKISEDLFDACVVDMHMDNDALIVRDDSRVLRSIDGYLYHSILAWLRRDYRDTLVHGKRQKHERNPEILEGTYKVFSPSAENPGKVLLGKLEIILKSLPDYIETKSIQMISDDTLVTLTGTIVRLDEVHCLWVDHTDTDMPQEGLRFNRLKITEFGKDGKPSKLCGWQQVFGVTRIDGYYRKLLLQKWPCEEDFESKILSIDDETIPDRFQVHLTNEKENLYHAAEYE